MKLRARTGTALLLALLVLIALECIILGTIHLAMLERRLADNAAAVLRLRLDAEAAARAAAFAWRPELDSIPTGERFRLPDSQTGAGNIRSAVITRVSPATLLVTAEARQPPPLTGRAAVALLLQPAALPARVPFADAALTAAGPLRFGPNGSLTDRSADCLTPGDALRLVDHAQLAPGAVIDGEVVLLPHALHTSAHLARIAALARPPTGAGFQRHDEAATLDSDFAGVLLALGDLHVQSGIAVHGLILVAGALTIAQGSSVAGAVHVGGAAEVHGALMLDACAAEAAAEAALLHLARPARPRTWLPGF